MKFNELIAEVRCDQMKLRSRSKTHYKKLWIVRLKSNVEVRSHALLSASSSSRWLNCPPSARLAEHLEDTTSDFAAEGTDAHTLCEFKLRRVRTHSR